MSREAAIIKRYNMIFAAAYELTMIAATLEKIPTGEDALSENFKDIRDKFLDCLKQENERLFAEATAFFLVNLKMQEEEK